MASPLIAGVMFTLTPTQPVFEIGEPLWLTIHVENRSDQPTLGWINEADDGRSARFPSVTDADGRRAPDPEPWRIRHPGPGIKPLTVMEVEVSPGDNVDLRIDLARYAWLDEPGTYEVTLLAPFGPSSDDGQAPPAHDPRWMHTELTLVRPLDHVAVVRAHAPTV